MEVKSPANFDTAVMPSAAAVPITSGQSSVSAEASPVDTQRIKVHESLETEADKQNNNTPPDSLDKALEKINKSLSGFSREMQISVHSKLHRIMVKVVDTEQNKVIREIPPEKVLDAFAKALELAGVLIDVKQ